MWWKSSHDYEHPERPRARCSAARYCRTTNCTTVQSVKCGRTASLHGYQRTATPAPCAAMRALHLQTPITMRHRALPARAKPHHRRPQAWLTLPCRRCLGASTRRTRPSSTSPAGRCCSAWMPTACTHTRTHACTRICRPAPPPCVGASGVAEPPIPPPHTHTPPTDPPAQRRRQARTPHVTIGWPPRGLSARTCQLLRRC